MADCRVCGRYEGDDLFDNYEWPVVNARTGQIVYMMPCEHLAQASAIKLNNYADMVGNQAVYYQGPKRPGVPPPGTPQLEIKNELRN